MKNEKSNRKTVDMVVELYLSMVKLDANFHSRDINFLYSILENLFYKENIPWESYIRDKMHEQTDPDKIINYLNRNLITLDKIRILLSLVLLLHSDQNSSNQEMEKVQELSKKFELEAPGFSKVPEYLTNTEELHSIVAFRYFNHTNRSIFKDFISFGSKEDADLKFSNARTAPEEVLLIMVENNIFLGTGNECTAGMNGKKLIPNRLYAFPRDAVLEIGSIFFKYAHLMKIYRQKYSYDVIDFKKSNYEFRILNQRNAYTINIDHGTVYKNGKELAHNRDIALLFDDVIQIKGYDPFWLIDVIEHREEIGTESLYPSELFIEMRQDYYSVTQGETPQSILHLFSQDNILFAEPPLKKNVEILVNNKVLALTTQIHLNTDIITINKKDFRLNNFFDLVEIPFVIDKMSFSDLRYTFSDGHVGLDGISFEVEKGELLAVMGLSGCGKSTLLKTISSEIIPSTGRAMVDGKDYYRNLDFFIQYVGYVPQDDLLYPELTVYENLLYRGKLRLAQISREHLEQKINNILLQLKLTHRKNTRVGFEKKTVLSGGERKRLNLALELLFEPSVIICDEPTSGLSSIDSEQIIEILKDLTRRGKIVIITIHQPNSTIFEHFDKVLILDTGGKQVYYGLSEDVFDYFDAEAQEITIARERIMHKRRTGLPEYLFEMVEYPSYKENGEIIYEQLERNLVMKRRFPPAYWQDKFKRKLLLDMMMTEGEEKTRTRRSWERPKNRLTFRENIMQFINSIKRNLLIKMRNRTNVLISFLEAPLLAIVIGFILRLAPTETSYSYYKNPNISIYIFISILAFIFLGLSNSVSDILSEKKIIIREKLLNIRVRYLLTSKFVALSCFCLVQVVFYTMFSMLILEIKGVYLPTLCYLFAAGMIGYSLGLLISSLLNSYKAITNILPLVLIPQIIFGGAVIQYEKMNRQLTVFERNPIPEVVQFIPSRWLFEGMFTAYAKQNTYDRNIRLLDKKRLTLLSSYKNGYVSQNEYLKKLYEVYEAKRKKAGMYKREVFTNEQITLATEFMDGKFLNTSENVFLSGYKKIGKYVLPTYYFNLLVLLLHVSIMNFVTYLIIRYYYNE